MFRKISYFVVGSLPKTNVAFFIENKNAQHTLRSV